jgi:hypothetical protein
MGPPLVDHGWFGDSAGMSRRHSTSKIPFMSRTCNKLCTCTVAAHLQGSSVGG